jgi:GT2 family glycosyltransferase
VSRGVTGVRHETRRYPSRPFRLRYQMLLSVVIVNWNARAHLLRCLESLQGTAPSDPWEAIVVDNASSDGSVDAVAAAAPWAKVIANQSNLGLPAANNQGIAASSGRYVLISNADVVYRPGALSSLIDALERHPRAAIAVPQLIHESTGQLQASAGKLPTLREAVLGSFGRGSSEGHWLRGWSHDAERPIDYGAEAAYLVRRTAIDAVGPQDERYPLDWEGVDWAARMGAGGWEIWFVPSAVVDHAAGASIKQAQARWVFLSHRGMYQYFSDRRANWQKPLLAALFTTRALVKLALIKGGMSIYDRAERDKGVSDQPRSEPV